VFIVFASDNSFDSAWAPHIVSDTIFDTDGKGLAWRYTNNAKGSINEDMCALYVKEILHRAIDYPKPRATYHGQ
jgi:hypothetical protein